MKSDGSVRHEDDAQHREIGRGQAGSLGFEEQFPYILGRQSRMERAEGA